MTKIAPILHLICGKIASGKSTLAAELAAQPGTVLLSEDVLLAGLFGPEMTSGADFMTYSARLRQSIGPHVVDLLRAGCSVVLDFQANTAASRDWMRGLVDAAGVAHQMHVLRATDELCLARLAARNTAGSHQFAVTPEQFARFNAHFTTPDMAEGFDIVEHATGAETF